jgi:hypothetical protein
MAWPPMLPQIASRQTRRDDLATRALEGGGFGVARIVSRPRCRLLFVCPKFSILFFVATGF